MEDFLDYYKIIQNFMDESKKIYDLKQIIYII